VRFDIGLSAAQPSPTSTSRWHNCWAIIRQRAAGSVAETQLKDKATNGEDKIAFYRPIRKDWQRAFKYWYTAHYTLGILAVLLSTLVAAKPIQGQLPSGTYDILAWALALITGLLAFLSPEDRGNRYRRAWMLLSSIITRYDVDGHTTPEDVAAVHEFGERIIHNEAGSRDTSPPVPRSSPEGQPRTRRPH
jgi:hypothetical protein